MKKNGSSENMRAAKVQICSLIKFSFSVCWLQIAVPNHYKRAAKALVRIVWSGTDAVRILPFIKEVFPRTSFLTAHMFIFAYVILSIIVLSICGNMIHFNILFCSFISATLTVELYILLQCKRITRNKRLGYILAHLSYGWTDHFFPSTLLKDGRHFQMTVRTLIRPSTFKRTSSSKQLNHIKSNLVKILYLSR